MKKKHLIATLITVAIIIVTLAIPVFAEPATIADEPDNPVASQDSSFVPTESVSAPSDDEQGGTSSVYEEPSSVYEEPSSVYEEPSSVYEEPSSVYEEPSSVYEEPSSSYDYSYEDNSAYTGSAATGSLLPETSADGASGTTSHNWDKLLENINSANAAGTENGTFVFKDDPDNTNNTGANDGGWILWTGLGFIFLAVCGISYVVYANFFSKNCPRKRLAAAQAAQKARMHSATAKRQAVSQQNGVPAKKHPDFSSSAYGDGYHYTKKAVTSQKGTSSKPASPSRQGEGPNQTQKPPQSRQYRRSQSNDDFWDKFFDK